MLLQEKKFTIEIPMEHDTWFHQQMKITFIKWYFKQVAR